MADVRKLACAKATDVASTKTSNAAAAKATQVTSAKATHMASTKAAHAPATVSSAAAGLCPRGKKAAGKHRACQNHHHSSSHDILHLGWADFPPQGLVRLGVSQQSKANVAMDWRWKRLFVVSTKFAFIRPEASEQEQSRGRGLLVFGRIRSDVSNYM
jgi:hypothetical protein